MGRRRRRFSDEELARVLVELTGPVDWAVLFGNENPVELDVGCGKGLFLVRAAAECPDVNFLGIDWSGRYARASAERVLKSGVERNARVTRADARFLLAECVPTASVQAVHVYFPDPWWKKRHKKRRLFTPEFVAQVVRVLKPHGRLHVATDVSEYADVIFELLNRTEGLRRLPPPVPHEPAHDLDYLTHFERKYRKEGRTIYRGSYERVA